MLTFNECEKLMRTARSPAAGKPVERNTRLFSPDPDTFQLVWHQTLVMVIRRGGLYHLYGGNQAVTIRERLNAYSPVWVIQRNFKWYVTVQGWNLYAPRSFRSRLERYPFHDGMAVHADLRLTGAMLRLKGASPTEDFLAGVPPEPLPAGYAKRWNDLCRPDSFDPPGWLVFADWLEDGGAAAAADRIRAELPLDLVTAFARDNHEQATQEVYRSDRTSLHPQ